MSIYASDKRVRYAPELGVWVVDMGEMHAVGADQLLATMMVYAEQAGDVPPGCVCFPESADISVHGVTTTAPTVHRIGRKGGIVLYGHGRVPEEVPVAVEANATECPCNNAEGEAQARELAKTDQWEELHALTVAFPSTPTVLQPAAPGSDAPAAWEGEPVTVAGMTIPDRHVHPDTRADLERLAALAVRSGE